VVRRCVWSRNIKNRRSIYIYIYIYDISSLRVKLLFQFQTALLKVMNWTLHSSAALTVPASPNMCPCFSIDLHLFQNNITQNLNSIKIHRLSGNVAIYQSKERKQLKFFRWFPESLHHSEWKQQEERLHSVKHSIYPRSPQLNAM